MGKQLLVSLVVAFTYAFLVLVLGAVGVLPKSFEFLLQPGPWVISALFGGFHSIEALALVMGLDVVIYASLVFIFLRIRAAAK